MIRDVVRRSRARQDSVVDVIEILRVCSLFSPVVFPATFRNYTTAPNVCLYSKTGHRAGGVITEKRQRESDRQRGPSLSVSLCLSEGVYLESFDQIHGKDHGTSCPLVQHFYCSELCERIEGMLFPSVCVGYGKCAYMRGQRVVVRGTRFLHKSIRG